MARSEIFYLLPYLGSLALSQGVLYYAWQRHQARGVNAYVWYVVGQTLWVFGFIVELLSLEMAGHSRRVTETTVTVAGAMDVSEDDMSAFAGVPSCTILA